jgi:hypothetical protein
VVSPRLDPGPRPERSFWELIPRRNFRRAIFLVLVLGAVLFVRHTGGLSLGKVFDTVAPTSGPVPAERSATYQHLEVRR